MAVKAWETEEKIIWILSKLEKLCVSINRINSQQDDREELQTKYKGVNISDYIKNSQDSTTKASKPDQKWAKDLNRNFCEEDK